MNLLSNSTPPTSGDATPGRAERASIGDLSIGVATELAEVIEAWQLVYQAYRRIGIIDANDAEVHATALAISPQTTVIVGRTEIELASTLAIMHDSPRGLPLDKVYGPELARLRERGERLLEVGLLADRRATMTRAVAAIFGMMRFVFYNSRFTGSTILCGVHPHHAGFYMKSFGFDVAGAESTHPVVKDQPVVLLRLDLEEKLKLNPLPRGLATYVANPLPADTFDRRFPLTFQAIQGTPIERFLTAKPPTVETPVRIAG